MQKLIDELRRLYLPAGSVDDQVLTRQISGQVTEAVSLVNAEGKTRALAIAFDKQEDGEDAAHWERLCTVANALQADLDLPAPAVSISGDKGFLLWLSLEQPVSTGVAQQFLGLLGKAYLVDVSGAAVLPPCIHPRTGRWAAFINPGLGASFADESGLEMPPPLAGQAALLENLACTSEKKFMHAMSLLQQSQGSAAVQSAPASVPAATPEGLLLRDATLEDIVRHLHSLNIEPTFRHLIGK